MNDQLEFPFRVERDSPPEEEPIIYYLPESICAVCDRSGPYRNVGRDHFFYCESCRLKWWGGSNLFSSWLFETEGTWAENAAFLRQFVNADKLSEPVIQRKRRVLGAGAFLGALPGGRRG